MRVRLLSAMALLLVPGSLQAQEIVKVPAGKSNVTRPDDLFKLPPGQWHMAKHLWEGPAPCEPTQCEAGFTSGDWVVSAEHSGEWVRIIVGTKSCQSTGYSELDVGTKPGKPTYGRITKQVQRVLKGVAKTCNATAPAVPSLEAAQLFPKAGE